jgi:U2 small nuclear ribonucleoprotein B''
MKYALYVLFSTYGEIKEIIVKKNNRMRGQAFIIFNDIADATAAKSNLDRYSIFEKQMVVND